MKLRIQDDTLRLRLTRSEVAEVRARRRVKGAIHFASGAALVYELDVSPVATGVSAEFGEHGICVTCPLGLALDWAVGDQVSIESTHSVPHVLLEKDFQCLHRSGEEDPEAYDNPLGIRGF
jgi:hypothetical protein